MDKLQRYLASGHFDVEGWLRPLAIQGIVALSQAQIFRGVTGSACEIGVHHGRLFILLHLLTQPHEYSAAWDLFDNQDENTDASGLGDRSRFEANLKRHGCDIGRIRIFAANSLSLTKEKILDGAQGSARLFSVDGGHTADITANDIRLAAKVLTNGGILLLDDCFNESWPGVAEGTCRCLADHEFHLIPFAIFGNKLAFTTDRDSAESYRQILNSLPGSLFKQVAQFWGYEVLTLVPVNPQNFRRFISRLPMWEVLKKTALGQWLKYSAISRWLR